MQTFKVEVTREDRWWMIHVPEIDGLTQARRIGEIDEMARSLISVSTDLPLDQVAVEIVNITVPGLGDIHAAAAAVADSRATAREAEERAAVLTQQLAKDATVAGIPVRDIAELLKVSPQRVSQLANQ